MSQLNREQVIKALECISRTEDVLCEGCDYRKYDGLACHRIGAKNALSLINELTEEVASLKEIAEGYQKQFEDCAEDRTKLTEENKRLKQCIEHEHRSFMETFGELDDKCKSLYEENERLRDLVKEVQEYNENWVADNGRLRGILLKFTDIVHKWGNKHGYDTSEISLVCILNEESEIKKQIREETIKEFQSRLNEQRGYDDDWNYNSWWGETINQIAKEMLENADDK